MGRDCCPYTCVTKCKPESPRRPLRRGSLPSIIAVCRPAIFSFQWLRNLLELRPVTLIIFTTRLVKECSSAQRIREKLPCCISASQLRFSVSTPCLLPTRSFQSDHRSHSAVYHRHHHHHSRRRLRYYSAKKLRRVLEILCGAFERCLRVRL